MRNYIVLAIGLVFISVGYGLEVGGGFLYLGYGLVEVAGLAVASSFLLWSIFLLNKRKSVAGSIGIVVSIVMGLSTWFVSDAKTSQRKEFYLLAAQVKPGDSINDVVSKLQTYRHWSTGEGHLSFDFTSRPDTTDVLVVRYDPKASRVVEADCSLD